MITLSLVEELLAGYSFLVSESQLLCRGMNTGKFPMPQLMTPPKYTYGQQ